MWWTNRDSTGWRECSDRLSRAGVATISRHRRSRPWRCNDAQGCGYRTKMRSWWTLLWSKPRLLHGRLSAGAMRLSRRPGVVRRREPGASCRSRASPGHPTGGCRRGVGAEYRLPESKFGCLGVLGGACGQVLTPGYRVFIAGVGDRRLVYHVLQRAGRFAFCPGEPEECPVGREACRRRCCGEGEVCCDGGNEGTCTPPDGLCGN